MGRVESSDKFPSISLSKENISFLLVKRASVKLRAVRCYAGYLGFYYPFIPNGY